MLSFGCESGIRRVTRSQSAEMSEFVGAFRAFLSQYKDNVSLESFQQAFCAPILDEIKSLKETIAQRDMKIRALEDRIVKLEENNDALEQYTRRNSVRISGINESSDEDCYDKVLSTLNTRLALTPPLTIENIDRLHRTGKPNSEGRARPILVKFTSYQHRARVMSRRKHLRGSNVFVNEDLTKRRNNLLWVCRGEKKGGRIKDCWTTDGRIMVRDLAGNTHLVNRNEDIAALTSQPSLTHPKRP